MTGEGEGGLLRALIHPWVHPQESSVCLGRSPLSCQDALQAPKALARLTLSRVLFALPQWFRWGTGSPLPPPDNLYPYDSQFSKNDRPRKCYHFLS